MVADGHSFGHASNGKSHMGVMISIHKCLEIGFVLNQSLGSCNSDARGPKLEAEDMLYGWTTLGLLNLLKAWHIPQSTEQTGRPDGSAC